MGPRFLPAVNDLQGPERCIWLDREVRTVPRDGLRFTPPTLFWSSLQKMR